MALHTEIVLVARVAALAISLRAVAVERAPGCRVALRALLVAVSAEIRRAPLVTPLAVLLGIVAERAMNFEPVGSVV